MSGSLGHEGLPAEADPKDAAPTQAAAHANERTTDADPKPEAPIEPALEDCCGSGCDPCVFDTYTADLHRYRAALAAWEARQAGTGG